MMIMISLQRRATVELEADDLLRAPQVGGFPDLGDEVLPSVLELHDYWHEICQPSCHFG